MNNRDNRDKALHVTPVAHGSKRDNRDTTLGSVTYVTPSAPPEDPDDYSRILILRPLRSDVPASRRIRAALKLLLRAYRLRCEHCGPADLYEGKPKPPTV